MERVWCLILTIVSLGSLPAMAEPSKLLGCSVLVNTGVGQIRAFPFICEGEATFEIPVEGTNRYLKLTTKNCAVEKNRIEGELSLLEAQPGQKIVQIFRRALPDASPLRPLDAEMEKSKTPELLGLECEKIEDPTMALKSYRLSDSAANRLKALAEYDRPEAKITLSQVASDPTQEALYTVAEYDVDRTVRNAAERLTGLRVQYLNETKDSRIDYFSQKRPDPRFTGLEKSVVKIIRIEKGLTEDAEGNCSGVIISQKRILSAGHCSGHEGEILEVRQFQSLTESRKLFAKVVLRRYEKFKEDFAVFELLDDETFTNPLPLAEHSSVQPDDSIFVAGFPARGPGLTLKLGHLKISRAYLPDEEKLKEGHDEDGLLMQQELKTPAFKGDIGLRVSAFPGNSGGPLLRLLPSHEGSPRWEILGIYIVASKNDERNLEPLAYPGVNALVQKVDFLREQPGLRALLP